MRVDLAKICESASVNVDDWTVRCVTRAGGTRKGSLDFYFYHSTLAPRLPLRSHLEVGRAINPELGSCTRRGRASPKSSQPSSPRPARLGKGVVSRFHDMHFGAADHSKTSPERDSSGPRERIRSWKQSGQALGGQTELASALASELPAGFDNTLSTLNPAEKLFDDSSLVSVLPQYRILVPYPSHGSQSHPHFIN